MVNTDSKKRFSIKWKLMIATGILLCMSGLIIGFISIHESRMEIIHQVENRLVNEVKGTKDLIESRMNVFYKALEVIAETAALADTNLSYQEKLKYIEKYMSTNNEVTDFALADTKGTLYVNNGKIVQVADIVWFKRTMQGKRGFTPPILARGTGKLNMVMAVPIFDISKNIIGALGVTVGAFWLSDQIKDIVVGKTGGCFILNEQATLIAHKNTDLVKNMVNSQEMVKTNSELKLFAESQKQAVESDHAAVDFYEYEGVQKIMAFEKMPTTNWTVIVAAPMKEFMGGINSTRARSIGFGALAFLVSLVFIFFITRKMIQPIQAAVSTLQDIAEGEGDLTVRLAVKGNDEITDLARYFNQTIEKIGSTIKKVKRNTIALNDMGQSLSFNMTETASSVNQISANIEGVKGQILNQASGVSETSATTEEIMRNIRRLNKSIERQATHVAKSSSSVEQMVATIASVTQTLAKTDGAIQGLASKTQEGKNTVKTTTTGMQHIAEESGALQEAASVIQRIASQTNLLAMNAAIEAAHAGESGKGFAVVADEIRKLAEESSIQGKTISSSLKILGTKIQEIAESTTAVEEKFISIFEVTRTIKASSASLTAAMQEQEKGSHEVLAAIVDINSITGEVKAGSAEMLQGGEEVAEEMRKLDDLTRVITDNMNEMASRAVEINNAVQEVTEMSNKNQLSIESLSEEVNKFKA